MPFRSKKQSRWAFATDQPFARRWAHQTDYGNLKDAGTDAGAQAHGPGGLMSTPGIGVGRKWGKRRKVRTKAANYSARAGETIVGNLKRGAGGKFSSAGAANAPVARGVQYSKQPKQTAPKAPGGAKHRGGKGKGKKAGAKPKAPKLTPEQRQAARTAEQAKNTEETLNKLNIGKDGQDALESLRRGEQPDPEAIARGGFEDAGLVERAADGSFRMTASGRALLSAAAAGDAGRAGDVISSARDKKTAKKPKAAAAKPAKPAKSGGGGGGKGKPDKSAEAEQKRTDTAAKVGLKPAETEALATAAEGGHVAEADVDHLAELGFVQPDGQGGFEATDQGRRALSALEHGNVRGYQAAVQDASSRMHRETDRATRAAATAQRRTAHDAATAQRRAATEARRRQRETERQQRKKPTPQSLPQTTKAERFGGKKRSALAESDFAGPNRTFPIMSAQDVKDAARLVGHAADPAAVKKKIIAIAKRKGFPIPDAWKAKDYPDQSQYAGHTMEDWDHDRPTKKPSRDAVERARKQFADALGVDTVAQKAFTVFKDASGKQRWILRTSTAFRDRDGEVITTKAQEDDAARMTATGQYGPLRYWHIGQPDPFDPVAPWGPGLDLGTCDYSTVIGRTRIESGTFYDAAIGNAIARSADDYEGSPGFFHALDQPDAGAHFTQVRGFERSLVPTKHARASNLFTGLAVGRSTKSMDQDVYNKRVAAFLQDMAGKGVAPEVAAGVIAQQQANEKDADDQQIAYKSEEVAPPGPPAELTINGVVYALKAAPPPEEVMVETQAAGDEAMEDPAAEGTPDDQAQDEGDYLGDMNVADFEAMLTSALSAALEPLVKGIDIAGKMSGHMDELKSMMGGYATKSEGVQAEIATLKARLAELEGSQPSVILSDDVAAALKSSGPAAPPDQSKQPVIPNEPDRPYAGITASLFPELYGGMPPAN